MGNLLTWSLGKRHLDLQTHLYLQTRCERAEALIGGTMNFYRYLKDLNLDHTQKTIL